MNAFQSETSLTTHQVKQRREDGKQREGRRSNCTNCNRQHPTGKCPAPNSRCRTGDRHGHWEAACRSKSINDGPNPSFQKLLEGFKHILLAPMFDKCWYYVSQLESRAAPTPLIHDNGRGRWVASLQEREAKCMF